MHHLPRQGEQIAGRFTHQCGFLVIGAFNESWGSYYNWEVDGQVVCCDAVTGEKLWHYHLASDYAIDGDLSIANGVANSYCQVQGSMGKTFAG